MNWTRAGQVRDSSLPGLLLRAVPGVLTIIVVVFAGRHHDQHRLPYAVIVALGVIVVASNVSLYWQRYGEPLGRAGYGLLVFAIARSMLWYALPGSAMIIAPFWLTRSPDRYYRPTPLACAVL